MPPKHAPNSPANNPKAAKVPRATRARAAKAGGVAQTISPDTTLEEVVIEDSEGSAQDYVTDNEPEAEKAAEAEGSTKKAKTKSKAQSGGKAKERLRAPDRNARVSPIFRDMSAASDAFLNKKAHLCRLAIVEIEERRALVQEEDAMLEKKRKLLDYEATLRQTLTPQERVVYMATEQAEAEEKAAQTRIRELELSNRLASLTLETKKQQARILELETEARKQQEGKEMQKKFENLKAMKLAVQM